MVPSRDSDVLSVLVCKMLASASLSTTPEGMFCLLARYDLLSPPVSKIRSASDTFRNERCRNLASLST